jgi:hypothetical protein
VGSLSARSLSNQIPLLLGKREEVVKWEGFEKLRKTQQTRLEGSGFTRHVARARLEVAGDTGGKERFIPCDLIQKYLSIKTCEILVLFYIFGGFFVFLISMSDIRFTFCEKVKNTGSNRQDCRCSSFTQHGARARLEVAVDTGRIITPNP